MPMKKALAFSLVVLGVTGLVAQVVLVRELLSVFAGNEFFIGWTLFAWLSWTALGAWLAGRWGGGAERAAHRLVVGHALVAVLVPAVLALIRQGRLGLGAVPGAVPDLLPALGFAFLVLGLPCLVLGAQFVVGARAWPRASASEAAAGFGRAYACETAGYVLGGLGFTWVFVARPEFQVAGWLGGLNVLAGFGLCAGFRVRSGLLRWLLAGTLAALLPALFRGERLTRHTEGWRFPGQTLIESRHSIYGQLAVTALDRQLNFYENGGLLGAEDEQQASEELAHYPLLWHPAPQRVLLVGNGFNGALGEILKHAPAHVDYVELDPELIALAKKYAAPIRRAALEDPRVNVVFADGRFFLNRTASDRYDVVIVNLPSPGTALINRFYTLEFYRAVRRRLMPGGVLAVRLPFSRDYVGPELENLGASLERTLRAVFATVAILPEYEILYLAADVAASPAPEEWIARHAARGLQTDFVIPPAIAQRLATDRIETVQAAFAANRTAQINRDGRPIACAYAWAHWLRSFHPRMAAFVGRASTAGWPWGAAGGAAILLAMALAVRRRAPRIGPWSMGIGGFSLMACELVLLLAFQAFCGYLYYQLALILAALMLGMALGAGLGLRRGVRATPRTLAGIHAGIAAFAVGLAGFLRLMAAVSAGGAAGIGWAFLPLAAAIGGWVGFEFPVASRIYWAGESTPDRTGGVVYGADLLGSCAGALLIGLWALPVLGAETTLAILAALNAATALVVARQPNPSVS